MNLFPLPEKIVFLFPGQGSQKVGMGKEIYEKFPLVREIFEKAEKILKIPLRRLSFEGPEEELTRTSNLQPILVTLSYAIFLLLRKKGLTPFLLAGHSLGEYSAVLASGVLDFSSCLRLVRRRGELMEKSPPGGMLAVVGLSREKVLLSLKKVEGKVEAVNFNSPLQVVISGEEKALFGAEKILLEEGAKRVIPLRVLGPFHSSLMSPVAKKFARELEKISFKNPSFPLVTNAFASYARTGKEIKEALRVQLNHPVRWEESMHLILSEKPQLFVELGPGRVLQGLLRQIDPTASSLGWEEVLKSFLF